MIKEGFEKTSKACISRLAGCDILSRADGLGAESSGGDLIIDFFGSPHRISAAGVRDAYGKPVTDAVSIAVCKYVLNYTGMSHQDGEWVTYREFEGAGPLTGRFTANTQKIIESAFAGNIDALEAAGNRLGGVLLDSGGAYDVSIEFKAFPMIPVRLHFNDRDDEFPAQCSILFNQSAEKYLDLECLSIAGTYLAGNLIASV